MGFGSGGGGFTPSPNNVPGSTKTGTDKDTDVHEFTGSVDITGSLTLNGSAITGGGGGGGTPGGADTQVQFNDAGNFGGSANFTFDGSNINLSNDTDAYAILGRAHIGSGSGPSMSDKAMFAHVDNATSTNYALIQRANGQTEINAGSGYTVTQRIGSQIKATLGADGFFGAGGNFVPQAAIHASSSVGGTSKPVFKADHADNANILVVTGSGRVGIGTDTPTAMLHVSGAASTTDPLFRIDSANQGPEQTLKPILFVTGSGLVGIGTDAPRTDASGSGSPETNRLHILGEYGADQGQDPVVNTLLMLENNDHAGIQFMVPNTKAGQITWGTSAGNRKATFYYDSNFNRYNWEGTTYGTSKVMQLAAGGDSLNIGSQNASHMQGTGTSKANLHISSSTGGTDVGGPVLLRVDHADQPGAQPILFVTGSGQVGIGTDDPSNNLHIQSPAGASIYIEADTDNTPETDTGFLKITQDGGNSKFILGINGNAGTDPEVTYLANGMSNAGLLGTRTSGMPMQFTTGNRSKLCIQPDGQVGIGESFDESDRPSALLHVSGTTTAQGTAATSPLLNVEHDDNANILFVTGSGLVGIGTGTPVQTLSVSGSAAFSGAFGSTAIETLTANGTISANTGLTLIDASSSLAVNNTLLFSMANGTFAGQEKKIRGLIISGSDAANSTGIYIFGSNIDSPPSLGGSGQIILSSSNPAAGPSFQRAGCSLVWDGSKWLPVGNYNFNINSTGF